MAKKSSSTKSTAKKSGTVSLLDQLAFWAVIMLAVVMFVSALITLLDKIGVTISSLNEIVSIFNRIALAIAMAITIFSSYFAARRKGSKWFTVWLVCAILVALSFILGITLI